MKAAYDVIVVGGGPVGAACARELSLAGRRVLLLDPEGESGQAWRAAAGMLAPQLEADQDDPLLELGLAARDHCDALATALRESIGADIGLWRDIHYLSDGNFNRAARSATYTVPDDEFMVLGDNTQNS